MLRSFSQRPARAAFFLCLLVATTSACPTLIPRPKDALTNVDAILAKANNRLAGVQSISVYARVWQGDILMSVPVRMDLIAKRPAKVYFAILDPTQNMLGALASDGETFTSFRRGESQCLKGPACAANVGRLLPLSLEPREIVSVLMGGAPTLVAVAKTVQWDERAGAYCVTLTDSQGKVQRVWVTHGTWLTRRSKVLDKAGALVLDIEFGDEKRVAGQLIAHEIKILVPKSKTGSVRIVYREVDLDADDLGDEAFVLECPKGASTRYLPCPTAQ